MAAAILYRPQSRQSFRLPRPKPRPSKIRTPLINFALILTQTYTPAYLHKSKDFTLFAPFATRCISANGVGALAKAQNSRNLEARQNSKFKLAKKLPNLTMKVTLLESSVTLVFSGLLIFQKYSVFNAEFCNYKMGFGAR